MKKKDQHHQHQGIELKDQITNSQTNINKENNSTL
jgi:hypothetical protein